MGKAKIIDAEIQLPEAIIQHIQSFLSGKEAARTTIFSKSWYTAWLTRPNLDFVQRDFVRFHRTLGDVNEFWRFVDKTLQRYEKFNLRIESLRLCILGMYPGEAEHCCFTLANELIMKAMKMGAVDLDFKISCSKIEFTLPREVLGNENLIRLSVSGCKIGPGKVCCSRLESLCLNRMWVEGDILWNIVSSCHLIEKLSLSSSRFLFETQTSTSSDDPVMSDSELPWSPVIEFGKQNVAYEFHKLKYLVLNGVNVHTSFFNDFSSKFPCLKNLVVQDCCGYKGIRISSPSLEQITFTQRKVLRAKFDVPNIRKFTYSGKHVPSLSFKTAHSNWESVISISRDVLPNARWFLDLNKLLTKLSQSRISLTLDVEFYVSLGRIKNFQVTSKPVVENLTVEVPFPVCTALFNILFDCCRPVCVTQRLYDQCNIEGVRKNHIVETAHKRFIQQQGTLILSCANHSSSGPCDIEEVNVEFFDKAVSAWRPFFYSSKSLDAEQRIRLRLRWGRREPALLK